MGLVGQRTSQRTSSVSVHTGGKVCLSVKKEGAAPPLLEQILKNRDARC